MTGDMGAAIALGASMPGAPDVDHPKPERLIAGNPRRETWNVVDAPLAPGSRLYCGIWRCEPGHWRIAFGPHEHELFTVLAGRCRVHGADGSVHEVGPGEALTLPPGFQGSFEVLEALTKSYAIVDVEDAPASGMPHMADPARCTDDKDMPAGAG